MHGSLTSLPNRLSESDYDAARQKLRETYGATKREAGTRFEQELARLFYRSGWTQAQLAKKEGVDHTRIAQLGRFGRFLDFSTQVDNSDSALTSLSESTFRKKYWSQTDKGETNERIRFRDVLRLIEDEASLKPDLPTGKAKPAVGKALVEKFADGKWHHRETLVGAFPDIPPEEIDRAIASIESKGTHKAKLETRRSGKSFDVRIFRRYREVPFEELKEKLGPLLTAIEVEARKNAATLSVPAVAIIAAKLRKLLEEWAE